tara:strand:+ start:6151 stop:6396 length:246 start_codon:yes stop_codon:yes gene_type:complete
MAIMGALSWDVAASRVVACGVRVALIVEGAVAKLLAGSGARGRARAGKSIARTDGGGNDDDHKDYEEQSEGGNPNESAARD